MSLLFCDRPHAKLIDFAVAQFVVAAGHGIEVDGKHLERGDLVPHGVLSEYALRCEYEPPLRRIELLEYVQKDPDLCEAYARRNKPPAPTAAPAPTLPTNNPVKTTPAAPLLQNSRLQTEEVRLKGIKEAERERLSLLRGHELVKLCRKANLRSDGTKEELRSRLLARLG